MFTKCAQSVFCLWMPRTCFFFATRTCTVAPFNGIIRKPEQALLGLNKPSWSVLLHCALCAFVLSIAIQNQSCRELYTWMRRIQWSKLLNDVAQYLYLRGILKPKSFHFSHDGSMAIYGVPWIPSIYPSHVSIEKPAPAGSVMGLTGMHIGCESSGTNHVYHQPAPIRRNPHRCQTVPRRNCSRIVGIWRKRPASLDGVDETWWNTEPSKKMKKVVSWLDTLVGQNI